MIKHHCSYMLYALMVLLLLSCTRRDYQIVFSGNTKEFGASYVFHGDALALPSNYAVDIVTRSGKKFHYKIPIQSPAHWRPMPHLVVSSSGYLLLLKQDTLDSSEIYEMNVSTGKIETLHAFSREWILNADYSNDDKYIAFLARTSRSGSDISSYELHLLDRTSKKISVIWRGKLNEVVDILDWSRDGKKIYISAWTPVKTRLIEIAVPSGATRTIWYKQDSIGSVVQVNANNIAYGSPSGVVSVLTIMPNDSTIEKRIFKLPAGTRPLKLSFSTSGRFIAGNIASKHSSDLFAFVADTCSGLTKILGARRHQSICPAISFVQWHPAKDLLLTEYVDSGSYELREYDVEKLLKQD